LKIFTIDNINRKDR